MGKIKLTQAQREFIERMRNGETVTFKMGESVLYHFGFEGIETISFGDFIVLLMDKIVSVKKGAIQLTETGKTIEL